MKFTFEKISTLTLIFSFPLSCKEKHYYSQIDVRECENDKYILQMVLR